MAEINAFNPAGVATVGSHNPTLSAGLARSKNFQVSIQNNFIRPAEYSIYVYSVSDFDFKVEKPWFAGVRTLEGKISAREHGSLQTLPTGEEYTHVTDVPHPLMLPKADYNADTVDYIPTDGMFVVRDLLSPTTYISDRSNDLSIRGLFYSMTNPPKASEVKAAIVKMEQFYRDLLEKARVLEMSDPKSMQEQITSEYHQAAEYFGIENNWHKKQTRPMSCPNCGESIKSGIAFHRDASGDMCILDWARALKAGKVTREQAYSATNDKQFAPQAVPTETAKQTPVTATVTK